MRVEYFIIIFVLSGLLFYAYRLYKFEKIYVDLWLYSQILLVFPYFVLYPFAGDAENEAAVGNFIFGIRQYLPRVFVCNCIGWSSMWIGKFCFDYSQKKYIYLSRFDHIVYTVLFNGKSFKLFAMIYLPFFVLVSILAIKYSGDELLLTMKTGLIMTGVNIAVCGIPVILSVCIINYIETKNKSALYSLIFFFIITLFMGRRSIIFGPLVSVLLMYFIYKGRKLKISRVVILLFIVLNSLFFMDDFRHGRNASTESLFDKVAYGNTFSDARDFAWILSGGHDDFLYGKTYLAGLLSFIPSSLSDFRTEWAWGRISLRLANFNIEGPTIHGGLRGGLFCEPYFNFGYIGIIFFAFIYGYISEWINVQHKYYCKRKMFSKAYACGFKNVFISIFMISSGAWKLYGLILPILIIYQIKFKGR